MINVATYHSINAKFEEQWLGYPIDPESGKQILIRFHGETEEIVIKKAQAFYEREKARQMQLYASTFAAADNDEDVEPKQYSGRGAQLAAMFAGKVWMLNRATGERARVLPGEVADYVAKGFEKGGPRSK